MYVDVLVNTEKFITSGLEYPYPGIYPVNLSYQLFQNQDFLSEGKHILFMPPRMKGQKPRKINENIRLEIKCPANIGNYRISIGTLQETIAWQSSMPSSEQYITSLELQVIKSKNEGAHST